MSFSRKKLNAEQLWTYAIKVLSARSRSSGELRAKLELRCERREDIDPLVVRLKELGYLDDRRFAESFAASRLANDGVGQIRTLRQLRERRVPGGLADKAVADAYANTEESELIDQYIRRKFRGSAHQAPFSDDRSLASGYQRLRRAGFSSTSIVRALKKFAKNPELLNRMEDEEIPPTE